MSSIQHRLEVFFLFVKGQSIDLLERPFWTSNVYIQCIFPPYVSIGNLSRSIFNKNTAYEKVYVITRIEYIYHFTIKNIFSTSKKSFFPGKVSVTILLAADAHYITCFMALPSIIHIPDKENTCIYNRFKAMINISIQCFN